MTPEQSNDLAKPIRILQIIVGAMVTGVGAMLVVAQLVGPGLSQQGSNSSGTPIITHLAAAYGVVSLVAAMVIANLIVGSGRRKIAAGTFKACQTGRGGGPFPNGFFERTGDAGRMCGVLLTATIIGAALIESGALFAAVAYLAEGRLLGLVMAALLMLALLMRFPTRTRAEQWIDGQLETLQGERPLGS